MSSEPDIRVSSEEIIYLYTFCGVVGPHFNVATYSTDGKSFSGRPSPWDKQIRFNVQTGGSYGSPAGGFRSECAGLSVLPVLNDLENVLSLAGSVLPFYCISAMDNYWLQLHFN